MTSKNIIQYGTFSIKQDKLDDLEIQMYQYVLAAMNHHLDISDYIRLYGKEYATKVKPNITDENVIQQELSEKGKVPFYSQSHLDGIQFVADSLNQKNQGDALLVLILLVDNYEASFDYIEIELDNDDEIKQAYQCEAVIRYEEVGETEDVIDIQTTFTQKKKDKIKLEEIHILKKPH